MTKEHKLALIVGFALVLVVGVLISDHFSSASSATLNNDLTARNEEAFGSGTGGLDGGIMKPPEETPEERLRREREIAERAAQMNPLPNFQPEPPAIAALDTHVPSVEEMFEDPITIDMGGSDRRNERALAADGFMPVESRAPLAKTETPHGFQPVNHSNIDDPANHPDVDTTPREPGPRTGGRPIPPAPVEPKPAPVVRHTVAESESLYKIAEKYFGNGNAWRKIREANPKVVSADGAVRAGVSLVIPVDPPATARADTTTTQANKPAPKSAEKSTDKPKREKSSPIVKPVAPSYALYTVKANDNLSKIAEKLLKSSKRAGDIASLNKLDDPDRLVVGMQLKIPVQ